MTMAKIVGDLIQGYSLKIACVVGVIVYGPSVVDFLHRTFDPVTRAMGNG